MLAEVAGEHRIRLERDERIGAEAEQPSCRLPSAWPDFQNCGAGTEPATVDENLVDLLRVTGACPVVPCGIGAEQIPPFRSIDSH